MSIDTGKVLDVEPLTKVCKQCQLHSHLDKDSEEHRRWRAEHSNCKAYYEGSAPAMESEGAVLDGLLQLIHVSFGILTCIQIVTAKVTIKSRMFILQMTFKLTRKNA